MHRVSILILLAVIFSSLPMPAHAAHLGEGDMEVRLLDSTGQTTVTFNPFDEKYRGDGSLFATDLGTDGTAEILVGAGHGQEPKIKIYRQDGSMITEFLAYESTMQSGVNVTACDLTGDGLSEIISGTKYGGGPQVRIFSNTGEVVNNGFFAYDETFRGGLTVACGDVDGDGDNEIVTGAGISGGPHIKIFDAGGIQLAETFAGSADENTGVNIAVGDLDGNGDAEIIAGRAGIGDPTITLFNWSYNYLSFLGSLPGPTNYQNGVQVLAADVDGDGSDEIGLTTNGQAQPLVEFYELTGAKTQEIKPFTDDATSGLTAARLDGTTTDTVIIMKTEPITRSEVGKYVNVDISDQVLRAYENTALVDAFLVSTGTTHFPTPTGRTAISAKLLWHDYSWYYGANNPNNYSLPNVKYNMRIFPHIYIHYAYWHNNFGHRMSHGCVNVNYESAEWIYNWSEVGTIVETQN